MPIRPTLVRLFRLNFGLSVIFKPYFWTHTLAQRIGSAKVISQKVKSSVVFVQHGIGLCFQWCLFAHLTDFVRMEHFFLRFV